MARPTKAYGRRSVQSYDRDREYLMRLRNAIWCDTELDSAKVKRALDAIDELLLSLRELSPVPARQTGTG